MLTDTGNTLAAPPEAPQTDFKTLQRLRQACRIALERYVDLASHGSGQLARLSPSAVDQVARINVALLQQKEQRAYEAYLKARTNLQDFVMGNGSLGAASGS